MFPMDKKKTDDEILRSAAKRKYEFENEEEAKLAFEEVKVFLSEKFMMEDIAELDGNVVSVPSWFPLKPNDGKLIK